MKNNAIYTVKGTQLALQVQKYKGQWRLKNLNKSFGNVTFCFIVGNNGKLLAAEYEKDVLCDNPLRTQWTIDDLIECDIETERIDFSEWKIIE